jgi:nucleoid-associated protein YgaU
MVVLERRHHRASLDHLGDTLSGIAQKYYGSQVNWKAIYEANKETIGDNPNLIRVGQVFKIPKLD